MPRPPIRSSLRLPCFFAATLAGLAALCLASAARAQGGPPPTVELFVGAPTEEAVVLEASGLTPEGEVLWVWLESRPRGAYSATFSGERLERADGSGTAVLERPEGVTLRSLFLVVDLATGETAAGTPLLEDEAYEPVLVDLPPGAWVAAEASGGRGPLLRLPLLRPWMVLVRAEGAGQGAGGGEPAEEGPARGAWKLEGRDGGPSDADGLADGVFEAEVAGFLPVEAEGGGGEASPPPERLRPTDLVVAFDLQSLRVLVSGVGRGAAGAGSGNAVSGTGISAEGVR